MRSTGAQTPMESYVGNRPINAVAAPMVNRVTISTRRRPTRSEK